MHVLLQPSGCHIYIYMPCTEVHGFTLRHAQTPTTLNCCSNCLPLALAAARVAPPIREAHYPCDVVSTYNTQVGLLLCQGCFAVQERVD